MIHSTEMFSEAPELRFLECTSTHYINSTEQSPS